MKTKLRRRDFLKDSACIIGGLIVAGPAATLAQYFGPNNYFGGWSYSGYFSPFYYYPRGQGFMPGYFGAGYYSTGYYSSFFTPGYGSSGIFNGRYSGL